MATWEFSHSVEKARCANRLQVWALPSKHALGPSAHWFLSHSHAAAAPEVPLLRCVNMSGENNPCGVKYFRPVVDLCQCCNLGLSFSHLSGHELSFSNKRLVQQDQKQPGVWGEGTKKKKKPQMFSRMFESCQMGVHYFFPCLRNVLGNISGTDTSPGLHSQWCGEEHPVPRRWVISHGVDYFNYSWSYGAELPVGSPVGLPGTLPVQQWAYTSAGRMCSEVRTLNEERWLQEKEREMTETE